MSDQLTVLEAASWAISCLGNDAAIRDAASVAGRVQACPSVSKEEAMAAWLFRACERPEHTVESQAQLLNSVAETFSPEVMAILRSLVVAPGASEEDMQAKFLASSPSAMRIRVCETTVGMAQAVTLLRHGSVGNMEPIRHLAGFAQFVYENASEHVDRVTLLDLQRLLNALRRVWECVANTTRLFNDRLAPPPMVSVRILAVMNEKEESMFASLGVDSNQTEFHAVFQALREKLGGTAFTESILDATLPLPKWGSATIVSAGTDAPA